MVTKKTKTFEKSMEELESIVADLEKGELPLEEQLKAFEQGVAVSRDCLNKLDEVEQRVQKLMESASGKLSESSFEDSRE